MLKSAEHGDYFYGGYYLALCYFRGDGTNKDEVKGFNILKKATEKFCMYNDEAKELLIECYENGKGTQIDIGEAGKIRQSRKELKDAIKSLVEVLD